MTGDEENQGFMPGPLDELVPGLRRKGERWEALPVHPRILEARRDDKSHALVMASFAPAANIKTFHAALKPLVEAALLSELSRPPEELRARSSQLRHLELYAFATQPFDPTPALATFALSAAPLEGPEARQTLALLRRECQLVDGLAGDEPSARFAATLSPAEPPLRSALADALLERATGAFGVAPGALARELCGWLESNGYPGVAPTRAGIERLEALVTHTRPFVIRWIEPVIFQALCDLVAVAALTTWNQGVEWGVCETDPDTLVTPPPVIKINKERESFHVPLGEHVLRWCIMPTRVGEDVPSLGAWAEHEFSD